MESRRKGGVKLEIINRQKKKKINLRKIKSLLKKIFTLLGIPSKRISVVFCDNNLIRNLNKKFFKKVYVTDVISFPLKDAFDANYLGEVVVSVDAAVKAARQRKVNWQEELVLYLIHGILHLAGYNDRTKKQREAMERKQNEILNKLSPKK